MPIVRELVNVIGFRVNKSQLRNVESTVNRLGRKMQDVGAQLSLRLTAPIVALGAGILKVAADFETAMNVVEVKSQATAQEMALLNEQARMLGATTQFSATQAANAMSFLAQAGFNAQEIMAAMPATLDLAAASGQDLAITADQLSNIMQGFGLDASEAGRAADVLALAASSSNTDVSQLAEAMKFAAPVAHAMGQTLEETAAFMGQMGNAGIQASMAGTTMRMSLIKTIRASDQAQNALDNLGVSLTIFEDGEEKARNFFDVLKDLEQAGAGIVELEAIFGVRSVSGMAAILDQGTEATAEFINELENLSQGQAAKQAAARMKGLNGAILSLKSALQEMALIIAESGLLEWATNVGKKLTLFVRGLSKTDKTLIKFGTIIAGVVAVAGPLIWVLGSAITMLSGVFAAMSGPLGLVTLGLIAIAPFIGDLISGFIAGSKEGESFGETLSKVVKDKFPEVAESLSDLALSFDNLKRTVGSIFGQEFIDSFDEAVKKIKSVNSEMSIGERFASGLASNLARVLDILNLIVDTAKEIKDFTFGGGFKEFLKANIPGFGERDPILDPQTPEEIAFTQEETAKNIANFRNFMLDQRMLGERVADLTRGIPFSTPVSTQSSVSKQITVNAKVDNITVPTGTTTQQADSIRAQVENISREVLSGQVNQLLISTSGD